MPAMCCITYWRSEWMQLPHVGSEQNKWNPHSVTEWGLHHRHRAKRGERAPALHCVRINDEWADGCVSWDTNQLSDGLTRGNNGCASGGVVMEMNQVLAKVDKYKSPNKAFSFLPENNKEAQRLQPVFVLWLLLKWGQFDNRSPVGSCPPLWMCSEEDEGDWFLGKAFVGCLM